MGKKTEQRTATITLHITERAPMDCALLKELLSKPKFHIRVVGLAVDSAGTMAAVGENEPDVALISAVLQEGPGGGLEILRQLRAIQPKWSPIVRPGPPVRRVSAVAFGAAPPGIYFRTD